MGKARLVYTAAPRVPGSFLLGRWGIGYHKNAGFANVRALPGVGDCTRVIRNRGVGDYSRGIRGRCQRSRADAIRRTKIRAMAARAQTIRSTPAQYRT